MARDVYVVGSVNVDLVVTAATLPAPGETVAGGTFERHGGGKSANQAVAAARLGARVRMVGAVGDDDLGEEAIGLLRAEGIDVSGVARLEHSATGVALIVVDEAGENQIAVASGANAELDAGAVERGLREAGGVVSVDAGAVEQGLRDAARGVVLLGLEVPDAPVLAGARAARAADLQLVLNPAPARELPGELLDLSPLLTPNRDEARALAGEDDAEAAARALAARTGAPVVVTLGAEGALVVDGDALERVPAPRVEAVDTTGAGDAFNGALACELAGGAALLDAVRAAVAVAAASTLSPGARAVIPARPPRGPPPQPPPQAQKFLAIYLQDHHAGSTGGLEMARRTAKANGGTEFVGPLTRLATEIAEDRDALKRIMDRLEVGAAPVKAALAWGAERAGRLKPNGQLRGYSPLGRLVEIEALVTGVSGKLSLWRALKAIAPTEPRLDAAQLADLEARAEDQLTRLHGLRDRAAVIAFS